MSEKLFIAPLSKEIIEATSIISNFCKTNPIGFIISKNQVSEVGYTGFDNISLIDCIDSFKFKRFPLISRDHSDCNFDDLQNDAKILDGIHIDPFKNGHNVFERSLDAIRTCETQNDNLFYEVATEEAVFPFTPAYLDSFLKFLKINLSENTFKKIKFAVIQCGTKLKNGKNIGSPDYGLLKAMKEVCLKYNITPKEHNGDFVQNSVMAKKISCCPELRINIAPEVGFIQSTTIFDNVSADKREILFELSIKNPNLNRWFSPDFDLESNKRLVFGCMGHYIYNSKDYKSLNINIKPKIVANIFDYLKGKLACFGVRI